MQYLPSASVMKQSDERTMQEYGMASIVLMERAALKVVEIMAQEQVDLSKVLIVCGAGNNGGDGFAVARLLHLQGHCVTVLFAGKSEDLSEEAGRQLEILGKYGVSIGNTLVNEEYSVVIDAIFGIGLSREIVGNYKQLIEKLNALKGKKIAIDISSGISADTGEIYGIAFKADITVTFTCKKIGMVLYPGHQYMGKVFVADIGIPLTILCEERSIAYTLEPIDIATLLPKRKGNSHKGSYGKALLIVGSNGMSGAAYLSAKACYAVGAGLVKIYTCEENRIILQQLLPEAIVTTYYKFQLEELQKQIAWADVVLIGSGLGMSEVSRQLVKKTIGQVNKPCVIDADALNLLADQMELLEGLEQIVLTPHILELSRLLNVTVTEAIKDREKLLLQFTSQYPAVCVAKDARTMVMKNQKNLFINTAGNSSMAKAGTGDVLAGIITGLLSQGMPEYDASVLGVYMHACAGDKARQCRGSYSVSASMLIEEISNVIKEHEEVSDR